MLTPRDARRLLSEISRRCDEEIDLAEAALLVAANQGSDPHVEMCLDQLDDLARRVKLLLDGEGITDPDCCPYLTTQAINDVLFEQEGFAGNSDDYYDIQNSYLDQVLARRKGIPITLSIVYMEVARRVGFPMRGIGLPGHFVIGYWSRPGTGMPALIVDAFAGGEILSVERCAERVRAAYGVDVRFASQWLQPFSNRQILERLLNNLKHIYNSLGQPRAALRTIDMLLMLRPGGTRELKERGLIYLHLGEFMLALADLRRYLKLAPECDDTEAIRYQVRLINRLLMSGN